MGRLTSGFYIDAVVEGEYTHHKTVSSAERSLVPCSDMCGRIVQVGAEASPTWKVGDRVLSTFLPTHQSGQVTEKDMGSGVGFPEQGVLCTHRVFPASGLVRAPECLEDAEASTLVIAGLTAWMSVTGRKALGLDSPEDDMGEKYVLVEGTGGVAIAGLQIAKAMGMKTIVTSSSDDKLSRARNELGADHTINYRTTKDWEKEVLKITSNRGVDIILETGGAYTVRKSFDCIAFGGLINCIGYTSGKLDPLNTEETGGRLNVNVLALRRNVTLKGIINGPKDRFEEMVQFYKEQKIKPLICKVFGFEEAKQAFKFLSGGGHFGKVVVQVK